MPKLQSLAITKRPLFQSIVHAALSGFCFFFFFLDAWLLRPFDSRPLEPDADRLLDPRRFFEPRSRSRCLSRSRCRPRLSSVSRISSASVGDASKLLRGTNSSMTWSGMTGVTGTASGSRITSSFVCKRIHRVKWRHRTYGHYTFAILWVNLA